MKYKPWSLNKNEESSVCLKENLPQTFWEIYFNLSMFNIKCLETLVKLNLIIFLYSCY